MRKASANEKLKERVKELRCLHELSRVAWQEDNDMDAILARSLSIIPQAMQFPMLAEVGITLGNELRQTSGFSKCKTTISSTISVGSKRYGTIKIGYRPKQGQPASQQRFLTEEKRLLKIIAREMSLYLKRAAVEDEKRKLQNQLQHAERLAFVGKLSAGVAHELNEPLGRILGFAQLIKKEGLPNVQQRLDLERIINASLYSREIIKKLMFFSRQMPQRLVRVDLNESIEHILTFINIHYQSREINIVPRYDSNLPKISADPVQISQVIVNLITNAIYAMDRGGDLIVATKRKQNLVILTVKDSGRGIAPEVQKKIFEPFFTTKPVGQGTGLGLSVVQGIVLDHRGTIHVKSKPGEGSTFEIRFPAVSSRRKKR
ncbi:MAG: sensor histidine kinase [Cyclobacteriaceae bacterium]